MPKKHRPKFPKPSSSSSSNPPSRAAATSSSSSSSAAATATSHADHTTVNDLLAHLRVSQPQPHTDTPRAPISTLRSLPPSLQHILANAEPSPPPRPRIQVGVPRRGGRTPGPPPPASWLTTTTTATAASRDEAATAAGGFGEATYKAEYHGEEDLHRLPDLAHIDPRRLAHAALVAIARQWRFHVVYDQHYLYTLRPGLKSALLAYISAYSPDGVGVDGLRVLFKDGADEDDDGGGEASSNEDMKHMDLTRALGPRLQWKDLTAFFQPPPPPPPEKTTSGAEEKDEDEVVVEEEKESRQDTWDLSPVSPARNRFSSLTHISLSHPHASAASWTRLTAFTRLIPTITHLSLSGWPSPASVDPPGVMKRFARSLLCLKWLDAGGCNAAFYQALQAVEWDRCWRGVETVVCSQGEGTPEAVREERRRAAEELRRCIRAVRHEMGGKWCNVVI